MKSKLILLYSGDPAPAMLEIGFFAVKEGKDVNLILVNRNNNDIPIDYTLVNYPVIAIRSSYSGVNLRRLINFPFLLMRVGFILFQNTSRGDIVITNTLDMLLIARIVSIIKHLRIRHQVRDLVRLQLGSGAASIVCRAVDAWLVRKCEILICSSPTFYEKYYSKIYSGKFLLLENMPSREIWKNFILKDRQSRVFKIGYIGVIRYLQPLKNLISAVQILNQKSPGYFVQFAGGGNQEKLQRYIKCPDYFNFFGRFEYSKLAPKLYEDIDLIFAVYDRNDMNCQIAIPTKFYESILTKIPILVSSNTYIGDLVERLGIGLAVDGEVVDALMEALCQISEPDSWYFNARKNLELFDTEKLFQIYDSALLMVAKDELDV